MEDYIEGKSLPQSQETSEYPPLFVRPENPLALLGVTVDGSSSSIATAPPPNITVALSPPILVGKQGQISTRSGGTSPLRTIRASNVVKAEAPTANNSSPTKTIAPQNGENTLAIRTKSIPETLLSKPLPRLSQQGRKSLSLLRHQALGKQEKEAINREASIYILLALCTPLGMAYAHYLQRRWIGMTFSLIASLHGINFFFLGGDPGSLGVLVVFGLLTFISFRVAVVHFSRRRYLRETYNIH